MKLLRQMPVDGNVSNAADKPASPRAPASLAWPLALAALALAAPAGAHAQEPPPLFAEPPTLLAQHPGGPVRALTFSHDGSRLAAVGGDQTLIWDLDSGTPVVAIHALRDELRFPTPALLLGSDGKGIEEIHLDDPDMPSALSRLVGDSQMALDDRGEHVLWWRYDGSLWLWRASERRAELLLQAASVSWGQSSLIAPLGALVELDQGTLVTGRDTIEHRLRAATEVPDVVAFGGSQGQLMAVPALAEAGAGARPSRQVEVWDLAAGSLVATVGQELPLVQGLAVDAEGTRVAAAHGKSVEIWSLPDGKPLRRFEHDTPMGSVAFLHATLVTGDSHGDVHLWELDGGAYPARTLTAPEALCGTRSCRVDALTLSRDGKTLVASLGQKRFAVWSLDGDSLQSTFTLDLVRVALSGDGRRAFLASSNGTILVLDVEARQPMHVLEPRHGAVYRLHPATDGEYLLIGFQDGTYSLFDVRAGLEVAVLEPGLVLDATSMAFAPDDRTLVLAVDGGRVAALDPTTGLSLYELTSQAEGGYAYGLGFSPDGRLLAAARGSLRVLEARTGRELARLGEDEVDSASSVRFSPDGRTLAWGDTEGRVWLAPLNPSHHATPSPHSDEDRGAAGAVPGGQLPPGAGGCACTVRAPADDAPRRAAGAALFVMVLGVGLWRLRRNRPRT